MSRSGAIGLLLIGMGCQEVPEPVGAWVHEVAFASPTEDGSESVICSHTRDRLELRDDGSFEASTLHEFTGSSGCPADADVFGEQTEGTWVLLEDHTTDVLYALSLRTTLTTDVPAQGVEAEPPSDVVYEVRDGWSTGEPVAGERWFRLTSIGVFREES